MEKVTRHAGTGTHTDSSALYLLGAISLPFITLGIFVVWALAAPFYALSDRKRRRREAAHRYAHEMAKIGR